MLSTPIPYDEERQNSKVSISVTPRSIQMEGVWPGWYHALALINFTGVLPAYRRARATTDIARQIYEVRATQSEEAMEELSVILDQVGAHNLKAPVWTGEVRGQPEKAPREYYDILRLQAFATFAEHAPIRYSRYIISPHFLSPRRKAAFRDFEEQARQEIE